MATYQALPVSGGYPKPVHGDAVETQRLYSEYVVQTGLATNDIIQLGYLPPWARVVGASLQADQLDSNGSPTIAISVGDNGWTGQDGVVAPDTSRYFTTTTIGRVASPANANDAGAMNGKARFLRNSTVSMQLIFATITTGAATAVTGNRIRFQLDYFIDEPRSGINLP